MSLFSVPFRDLLPDDVKASLNSITGSLKGFLLGEHHEDGTHGDVTADSLSISGGSLGEWVEVPYGPARFYTDTVNCVWTVEENDQRFLKYMKCGNLAIIAFDIEGSTLSGTDTAEDLFINLPELDPIIFSSKGQEVLWYSVGVCNTATDGFGTFSIGVGPCNFGQSTTHPGTILDLDRFGGNWHLEANSVCVRGQIILETKVA